MKISSVLLALLSVMSLQSTTADLRAQVAPMSGAGLKVVLLGTAGGPTFNPQRLGISTLVLAGPEKLLFDCGRSLTTGMARLAINPADVTKIFLTHLHSDHVVALPELYLAPWASQGRQTPCRCGDRRARG